MPLLRTMRFEFSLFPSCSLFLSVLALSDYSGPSHCVRNGPVVEVSRARSWNPRSDGVPNHPITSAAIETSLIALFIQAPAIPLKQ
jgi:hypothetical protein